MTVAVLLLIATLLPLLSFVILAFVGKRMGKPLAGIVGTFFIAAAFVCSLAAMIVWLSLDVAEGRAYGFGGQPILKTYDWLPGGLQIGLYVDSLTVVMFSMITLVASLVHVFSLGYMAEDRRFPRFYTYLSLFSFSMLGLVLGATLLQLFIFWELVGLCSYLLIGFWYEKQTVRNAAIKAFLTNRVGDVGFIIGLGLLFFHLGNVTFPEVWGALGNAGMAQSRQVLILPMKAGAAGAVEFSGTIQNADPQFTKLPHMTTTMLTLMGIGLFFGAIGKSAQFPLHVWLPDAMEGPTPVSALIHAATMVAAGVYLVGRIFPILTPDAKLFIAIIGCITMVIGALIALAQTDIKRVLAYSTVSQLGLMILAMGIGSWVGGLFHLITHAFFKSLLFLGAGSVIHAAHHELELTEYGGLWRKIPYTAITFGIAVLAIAGVGVTIGDRMIGFAGYYSKDLILHHAGAFSWLATQSGGHRAYWLFFIMPTIVAYLTAFYMTRCWMLTFAGRPRNQKLYDHAQESPVMYIPLALLAVLSVIGGTALGARPMIESAAKETGNLFDPRLRPPATPAPGNTAALPQTAHFAGFSTAWQNAGAYARPQVAEIGAPSLASEAYRHGEHSLRYASFAFLVGIALGVLIYSRGFAIPNTLLKIAPLRWINIWLYRGMYFDELYNGIFVAFTLALSTIAAIVDCYVIDALINLVVRVTRKTSKLVGLNDLYVVDRAVSAAANMAQDIGAAVRAPQTGRIRTYVTALMVAMALGLAGAIIVVLSARSQ
jgi:proton-translocating NADH-quinone oxidoreductase chain L